MVGVIFITHSIFAQQFLQWVAVEVVEEWLIIYFRWEMLKVNLMISLRWQVPRLTPLTRQGAEGKMRSKVGLMCENVAKIGQNTEDFTRWWFQNVSKQVKLKFWSFLCWSYGRAMTWTTCQTARTLWRACRIPVPWCSFFHRKRSFEKVVWVDFRKTPCLIVKFADHEGGIWTDPQLVEVSN